MNSWSDNEYCFCCSVTQSCPTLCNPLDCNMPSFPLAQSLSICSNSCMLSQWCHPIISSSVIPFSSCLQSFPASRSFPMSWLFTSGGQSIGVSASASVLPMNIQEWSPLRWTCWITLLRDSQEFSPTRHFESISSLVLSFLLWSNSHIGTWLLGKPWLWP